MTDSRYVTVDVEPGDPHNDQLAARARADLGQHVKSTRATLTQTGGGVAEATAVVAVALTQNADAYPPARLAAMLAAALVKLAGVTP